MQLRNWHYGELLHINTSTQITANITIAANATAGARSVTVTNTDAQSGTLTNAFTVENVKSRPYRDIGISCIGGIGCQHRNLSERYFQQALDPSTVNTNTFRLLDSTDSPVPASVTYNASTLYGYSHTPPSSPSSQAARIRP